MWSWSPMSFFKSSGEVLKKMARFAQEEWLRVQLGLLAGGQLSEHGRFCGLQHTTQPAQDGEGEDHLTIIGLLVVPAQEIGHGPDEGGEIAQGMCVLEEKGVTGGPLSHPLSWASISNARQ